MTRPILAVTIGDPAGIGPEIALKAVRDLAPRLDDGALSLLLVGDAATLQRTGADLGLPVPDTITEAGLDDMAGAAILATPAPANTIAPGKVSPDGGEQAYRAVELATRLAMEKCIAGIVTGPLNKEALHLAGHDYAGHTEMLADLTGVRDSVMMLAHGDFRVSHVSTHCALQDVTARATPERISRVVDLTHDTLIRMGIVAPRIAIAALNPHAGEGGIFGRHDIDVTEPLVRDYVARGRDVIGPVPGDTVFVKLKAGQYDAVVAMYHDQGHIPVKLLGFAVDRETGRWTGMSGVNVTLGLPIIRTSVDHGTAFDIAGQGIADSNSLIEAIDYALQLAPDSTHT
ncbi:4-hydroxythreonine-4-phosphate dehydrogenase PdxA [Oceaniglobus indicus]|uniref:4-hydroxythreonine-4-phosphate dehydrogenase PdxA n=1 Tax=Oceaniglobus indicus TaxID=2047749 RepID=UPI000C191175|nr:4-hydroxythreonine-4-phosphate dehydrogenase PdxA [Oceaniglobus indicus]